MMNSATQTSFGSDNDLKPVGQIRLAQLSVYNWGSFEGLHTVSVDPVGTLITGDNGAGKSTLIDGLMALLLPAGKATFNVAAAQGDRADRSLLSYMRGSYGSAHDGSTTRTKSKREGAVVTGLRALYRADGDEYISLCALFWVTQASSSLSDVKRLYIISKSNITLEGILEGFGSGDIRSLKNTLKDNASIAYCDNNFTEYQEVYRRVLYMQNKNAPALLSRALGLKKIDDLTDLIRSLVLEPSTVKDDARKVVSEFGDLVSIHNQLIDAKEQHESLQRLPGIENALRKVESELVLLVSEREGLPIYIAEQCASLYSARVEMLKERLGYIAIELGQLEEREKQAVALVEQCHEAYVQAGGNRIENLKKDLEIAKEKLEETTLKASQYQKLTSDLKLESAIDRRTFEKNHNFAKETLLNHDENQKQAQISFADKRRQFLDKQEERELLTKNIQEIKARPDSNVDQSFQRMRDEMINALNLKSEEYLFIGELIAVKAEHRHWQGAIERALGGLRTTLLVPKISYHLVTRWLNQTHTGLHARVQVVDYEAYNVKAVASFKQDGYLRKLDWKSHPYRDWLKHHLASFDLHCVESTTDLDVTPFSMTQQGLIHKEKGRFEKIDHSRIDDERNWQLGFSNKSRLSLLLKDEERISAQLAELAESAVSAQKMMNTVQDEANNLKRLLEIQWQHIDAPTWNKKANEIAATLGKLEKSDTDLVAAKENWDQAKENEGLVREEIKSKSKEQTLAEASLKTASDALDRYRATARGGLADDVRELLSQRVGSIAENQLDDVISYEHRIRHDIDVLHEKANDHKQKSTNEATGIMGAFRQKWSVIANEWGASIQHLPDYLGHLEHLEEEGLPSLVEKFKERLNKHTTQSIATIKSRIETEREDIIERIDTINKVLKQTEFRSGSHLKLGLKSENYPHVIDFNKRINRVLSQATSDDHELRFNSLQEVVEILDRASAPATANNMESLRLLDPRHQLSFHAEEINTETGEVLDVLESSSGKSGGEKESFAGIIVAASLAYVLTPDGQERPVYSTVFLDEAFSNTAEAVSRRVLRVFKELNIHVNLITPYKNLNLARESAQSLIIAERDQLTHESRLCEVTWEEIDRMHEEKKAKKLVAEARSLGVVMNE